MVCIDQQVGCLLTRPDNPIPATDIYSGLQEEIYGKLFNKRVV